MTFLKIAFRNVIKNWRHSLAAIITVAVGLVSQVMFQGYIENIKEIYDVSYKNRGMFGDLLIENADTFSTDGRTNSEKYLLTLPEQKKIKEFFTEQKSKIQSTVDFLQVTGMISNGYSSQIFWGFGYDPESAALVRGPRFAWNTIYGIPLQKMQSTNSLLLGQTLAHNLRCDPVSKFFLKDGFSGYPAEERPFKCQNSSMQLTATTIEGQVNAIDLEVMGIVDSGYKEINSRYVELPLKQAQILINTEGLSYITVLLKNSKDTVHFISDFNTKIKSAFPQLRAIRWQDHPAGEIYKRTMNLLTIFRNFVLTVIFSISCLSVLNTMIKIIKERTREVGTLRSLGFLNSQVQKIFLMEAFFLSALGCLLGAVLTIILTVLLNSLKIQYKAGMTAENLVFSINTDPRIYFLSFLILTTLAVLTAYFACKASLRKQITDNLSYA